MGLHVSCLQTSIMTALRFGISSSTGPGRSWQPGFFHRCNRSGRFDVGGNAPRLVARESMPRRSPARLVLEVDVGERVAVGAEF